MANRHFDTLFPILVIAGISFLLAWGLFALLSSSATLKGTGYDLGGGIAGFVFVMWLLMFMHNRLDVRRAEELANEIARLIAVSIVRDGGNDPDVLTTAYNDKLEYIEDQFSRQDKRWKRVLRLELKKQTKREVHDKYPELLGWSPEFRSQPTVIETLSTSTG